MISVIVTIYNLEQYLRRCVDSIIAQTFHCLEIILVDDGSTDASPQICDAYARSDPRVRVIHKQNGGAADARNAGLEIATGEYIGFVDGDDFIMPGMYEALYHACAEYDVPLSMCGRIEFDVRTGRKRRRFCMNEPVVFSAEKAIEGLLTDNGCDSASWDKLYHRSLFSKIRYPAGAQYDDLNVTARLIDKAGRMCHVGEALYVYLRRDGSITELPFHKKHMDEVYQANLLKGFVDKKYPALHRKSMHFVYANLDVVLLRAYECKDPAMQHDMETVTRCCRKYFFHVMTGQWKIRQKLWFLKKYFIVKGRIRKWKSRETDQDTELDVR